jgi:hypothetical protein
MAYQGSNGSFELPKDAYNLSPLQMDELELGLVLALRGDTGVADGVVCSITGPQSRFANFGRTTEQEKFTEHGEEYDFHEGMAPYEDRSQFLYTVDLTEGRIAHSKRLVSGLPQAEVDETGLSGIEAFDDRVDAALASERLSLDAILAHHGIASVDQCLNVATNNRTKRIEQVTDEEKLANPYTFISYKGLYLFAEPTPVNFIIAYLNPFAAQSLAAMQLDSELLGGKEFHLPLTGEEGGYDEKYSAFVIPINEHNSRAFTEVDPENPMTALIADREVPLFEVDERDNVSLLVA